MPYPMDTRSPKASPQQTGTTEASANVSVPALSDTQKPLPTTQSTTQSTQESFHLRLDSTLSLQEGSEHQVGSVVLVSTDSERTEIASPPDIVDLTYTQSQADSGSLTSDLDSTTSIPSKFKLTQSVRCACHYLSEGLAQLPATPTTKPAEGATKAATQSPPVWYNRNWPCPRTYHPSSTSLAPNPPSPPRIFPPVELTLKRLQ